MFHSAIWAVSVDRNAVALWCNSLTQCSTLFQTVHNLLHSMKTGYLALEHFRALKTEKPRSKIAFLRCLYPDIAAILSIGHSLKDIHRRLVQDGIDVSYPLLRTYIGRIRRERSHPVSARNMGPLISNVPIAPATLAKEDPLANALRVLAKPRYDIRKAMCDGDPTKKKLI